MKRVIKALAIIIVLAETVNLSWEMGRNAVWAEDEQCSVWEYTFGMGQTVGEWLKEYSIIGKWYRTIRRHAIEDAKVWFDEDTIVIELDGNQYIH